MSLASKDIFDILEQNRERLRSFGVRQLGLFGSFARGENTESSDLNFLVEFETKSFDTYIGLKQFLEELFGRQVDLVLPNTIKPRLCDRILAETVYAQGL